MKRSKTIRLILIGSLTAGTFTGCGPKSTIGAPVTRENVYANNYEVAGVGYYHAPYRAWYQYPYNYFDTQKQRFFYAGQWWVLPDQTITNVSSPTAEAVKMAQDRRTDLQPSRGGFGSSSHHHSIWS